MQAMTVLLIIGGLLLLALGGEVLVRGAGGLARSLGMSPLLVGLTVVAFATSAPELAVSVQSASAGTPGLAVGNVVGSNIANVLLILGLSAVIAPLTVASKLVRRDVPVMIGVSVLVLVLSLDQKLDAVEGLILLTVMIAYLVGTIIGSREATVSVRAEPAESEGGRRSLWLDGILVAVGVAMLVLGAGWLVDGATAVAHAWGVSDLIIGLTVVAVGTSLPELATSLVATLRGERDIAVGNIVGSCVFNLGIVLSTTALVSGGGVPVEASAVRFDVPVMVAAAVVLLPVAFIGGSIARWEGAAFVAFYAAYLVYLVLTALQHSMLPAFSLAMTAFVLPLAALTLIVLSVAEWRRR